MVKSAKHAGAPYNMRPRLITHGRMYKKILFLEMYAIVQLVKQPPEVYLKKAVLKIFLMITRKHLCWSLFLIKLQSILK